MEMIDLVNQEVHHKNFGKGIICGADDEKYLKVKFEQKAEACKFAYPQCFYGYLTLDDSKLQSEIISVIQNWKIQNGIEEWEKLQCKHRETLRGIESRRNAAEEKKLRASRRAAEHQAAYNIKKETKDSQ